MAELKSCELSRAALGGIYARLGADNPNPALASFTERVATGDSLSRREAREVMGIFASGQFAERQAAEFLVSMARKGVTSEELIGFAEAVRERSPRLNIGLPSDVALADTCGTGCDALGTINVSTTTMFIVAAAGVKIAKHGNKAVTSRSGSADVLERLGVNLSPGPEVVARCIREVGIGFLFAPGFHESFRHVQGVRRALMQAGVKTIFNYLGPLTNPARTRRQLVGVFRPEITRLMAATLQGLGAERALCVCGRVDSEGGQFLDEFSTLGETEAVELRDGKLRERRYTPQDFGLPRAALDDVRGGDAEENARILLDILSRKERGPKRDLVLLNAGAALYICKDGVASIAEGIKIARSHLDSGAALERLELLKRMSAV
jgi:anthranilate phosphoribosyltransferase